MMLVHPLTTAFDNYSNHKNFVKSSPSFSNGKMTKKCNNDLFVQQNDINFKGTVGGTLGAVSGEFLALGITRWCDSIGVLGSVVIFLASIVGAGILGDKLEEKFFLKKEKDK